jgi:hypothetical protein
MKRHILASLVVCLPFSKFAFAQSQFQYKNDFSTTEEAQRAFGFAPLSSKNDPSLNAGSFKFDLGSKLECGKLDINANFRGQWQELQSQLRELIPNKNNAPTYLTQGALLTVCYAYPTICAQLRHDWLSIQGKLNLRAQACAAVDKFIDSQADKGARQLRSEAQAACVREESLKRGVDMAMALKTCQTKTGLAMRDFQTGVMRKFGNEKQRVLRSILAFAKDETSYDLLTAFLGEILVNTDGGWEPLYDKGLLRPADVADTFLTKGQGIACARLADALNGRLVTSNTYETDVVAVIKRRFTRDVIEDLDVLSTPDRKIACLALGRAIGREAALRASARYESAVATGLLNTAIPEPLRDEYRARSLTAFPALRSAIESESIPSVEAVRADLAAFANVQRRKTALLAAAASRGRLKNAQGDADARTDCTDSLTCQ